jgi:hypothetical protein
MFLKLYVCQFCEVATCSLEGAVKQTEIIKQLPVLAEESFEIIKTAGLYWFDGKPGYSLGQGERP